MITSCYGTQVNSSFYLLIATSQLEFGTQFAHCIQYSIVCRIATNFDYSLSVAIGFKHQPQLETSLVMSTNLCTTWFSGCTRTSTLFARCIKFLVLPTNCKQFLIQLTSGQAQVVRSTSSKSKTQGTISLKHRLGRSRVTKVSKPQIQGTTS